MGQFHVAAQGQFLTADDNLASIRLMLRKLCNNKSFMQSPDEL
jgi:hypothetical protein